MIPMEKWSKDHWSTFAYIETCIVDDKGAPDHRRMRTDHELHPGLGVASPISCGFSATKYPTRLKGGDTVDGHDDWSCLDDAEAAGLLTIDGTGIYPNYALTDKGRVVARALRDHKGSGGSFSTFAYTVAS